MSSPATLVVRDVSAGYGAVQVLRGVSVTAQAGTITAVLGANGAGKTTLLRAIDGSIKPTQGQVTLDDPTPDHLTLGDLTLGDPTLGSTVLTGKRPEDVSRAGVAHVPEGQGVITELTVAENLQLGLLLQPRGQRAKALAGLYDRFTVLADRRNNGRHAVGR